VLPNPLQKFLKAKYGIMPDSGDTISRPSQEC